MDVRRGQTMGDRVREIRQSRGMSQAVLAGLAGLSEGYISLIETGKRQPDRRQTIEAIANALQVSPFEIATIPISASGDAKADAAVSAIRRAIQAVDLGVPGGEVQPVEQLAMRVATVLSAKQRCLHGEVGLALPSLIRDLHTSIDAGSGDAVLLRLATELHAQGTQAYLHGVGAQPDLCWSAVRLAVRAAERLDEPVPLGVAAFGVANGALAWGDIDLAVQVLARTQVGAEDDMQLAGMLTLTHSLVAVTRNRPGDADAALDEAARLAAEVGEGNAHYMSFGLTNVSAWRVSAALEAGDHERAATLAETIRPEQIVAPTRRANYYVNLGRALTRLPRRRDDAVLAFREAERISPDKLHRNPFARDVLAELVSRVRDDAIGRDLRGMAYRAGLPV